MSPHLQKFLGAIVLCGDDGDLAKRAFTQFTKDMGVDNFILGYGAYDANEAPKWLNFWSSLDDSYHETYMAMGIMFGDMIIERTAMLSAETPRDTVEWSAYIAEDADAPELRRAHFQLLEEHGLGRGVSFIGREFEGDNRRGFGLSFGMADRNNVAGVDAIMANSNELLIAAFAVAPFVCAQIQEEETGAPTHKVTEQEKRVLEFHADGLNVAKIADKLNLSEHGVYFHFSNIKKKLNAQSMPHAMARAFHHGILHVRRDRGWIAHKNCKYFKKTAIRKTP